MFTAVKNDSMSDGHISQCGNAHQLGYTSSRPKLIWFKSRSSKFFFVHQNLSKNVHSQFPLWFIS